MVDQSSLLVMPASINDPCLRQLLIRDLQRYAIQQVQVIIHASIEEVMCCALQHVLREGALLRPFETF